MRQLVLEKENSEFKPIKLHLKIDLVSYPAQVEGFVNMVTRYKIKKKVPPSIQYKWSPCDVMAKVVVVSNPIIYNIIIIII